MVKSSFIRYIVKRAIFYVVILFVAYTVLFFSLRLIPGDPVSRFVQYIVERYSFQDPGTLELVDVYKQKFGLDKDIFTQYVSSLRRIFLEFDFGPSFYYFPKPAQEVVLEALPWSIGLLSMATVIAWVLGVIAGILVGWKRGTKIDSILFPIALCFSQIPYYLAAVFLLLTFSYTLGIFPKSGAFSPTTIPAFNIEFLMDILYHATLPAISMVLVSFFAWLISTRALTVSILGEDYLLFAQARGLKRITILNRYIFRNILLPQVTGLGMSLGFAVNGFYLIEWLFRYPGIGSKLVIGINGLDYSLVQAIIFTSISTVLLANFIIDLIYPLLDPRIKRRG